MTVLDLETIDLSALDDEKLWDLLGSAQAQVQDIAQVAAQLVWNKSEELKLSTGFTSIKEMIGDPHEAMPLTSKLNFYRNKVQVLRRQAAISSFILTVRFSE